MYKVESRYKEIDVFGLNNNLRLPPHFYYRQWGLDSIYLNFTGDAQVLWYQLLYGVDIIRICSCVEDNRTPTNPPVLSAI
jgi:hypothetical protein